MCRASLLCLFALSGCYASHTLGEADGAVTMLGDLPEGVVFDAPDGRFREVILTDAPLACDAVEYIALDTTGDVTAIVPRWVSLVVWSAGPPSYFYHSPTNNIGPGPVMVTIADRFARGHVAIGDPIDVDWSADVVTLGHLSGPSRPRYCGVFAVR